MEILLNNSRKLHLQDHAGNAMVLAVIGSILISAAAYYSSNRLSETELVTNHLMVSNTSRLLSDSIQESADSANALLATSKYEGNSILRSCVDLQVNKEYLNYGYIMLGMKQGSLDASTYQTGNECQNLLAAYDAGSCGETNDSSFGAQYQGKSKGKYGSQSQYGSSQNIDDCFRKCDRKTSTKSEIRSCAAGGKDGFTPIVMRCEKVNSKKCDPYTQFKDTKSIELYNVLGPSQFVGKEADPNLLTGYYSRYGAKCKIGDPGCGKILVRAKAVAACTGGVCDANGLQALRVLYSIEKRVVTETQGSYVVSYEPMTQGVGNPSVGRCPPDMVLSGYNNELQPICNRPNPINANVPVDPFTYQGLQGHQGATGDRGGTGPRGRW